MHNKALETAKKKVSASTLVVIHDVFTQFLILIKVSGQKRHIGNSYVFLLLYLHRFNHFSLFFDNLGSEGIGGIMKQVAIVDMILKFLITEKSIMAEMSSVPSQVSKCSTTSAFHQRSWYRRGRRS